MKHYTFGSSTAGRTDTCPAWFKQAEGIPRSESQYAVDGSMTHQLLEDKACIDDYDFAAMLGVVNTEFDQPYTEDHIEMAKEMWRCIEEILERHGALEWEAETTGQAAEDVGGTLDMIATCRDKALLIDYKTGRGVSVSPVNNKQLLFATAVCEIESGAADMLEKHDNFVGIIIQPNRAGEVEVKEWEFTREMVDAFWEKHLANIDKARTGDTEPVAGDHCKFCPANGLCDATTGQLLKMKQLDPEDVEQVAWGLSHIAEVKATIASIEKMAYEQLEVGVDIPGWKLVAGRPGNTTWDDAVLAIKKLKRMVRGCKEGDIRVATLLEVKKPITPTQAKKLLKKHAIDVAFLDNMTHRPEAKGHTLAPESDKRAAILSSEAFGAALASVK